LLQDIREIELDISDSNLAVGSRLSRLRLLKDETAAP